MKHSSSILSVCGQRRFAESLPTGFSIALACFLASTGPTAAGANHSPEIIAGTGASENNGDAGEACVINIGHPFGVEIGPEGDLYITEVANHRIRKLDLQTSELTTVAGCGRKGYSGDSGPAIEAELNEPYEVRFDDAGNMFFVEMRNHVIRRVDAKTGVISTVAGTGQAGFSGDGGPAAKAQMREPHSIALDDRGGLYIADIGNHRIRRVDLATGIIESIAGSDEKKLPTDGQIARGAPLLGPRALAINGQTLWIALREGHSVWRLDLATGKLRHVAGDGERGYAGDGGPAKAAKFNGPKGIAVGQTGDVYVADTENNAIRRIDVDEQTIGTIAGGAPMTLKGPHGVCVGPDGAVYIGDSLNHVVRRVAAASRVSIQNPQAQVEAAMASLRAGNFGAALGQLDLVLKTENLDEELKQHTTELAAAALHWRGEDHFRHARIAESIADFDHEVKLHPDVAPGHWQRGIAYYYAQEYEKGAEQFELHQTVNPQDVENAAWHFLCVVRAPQGSVAKARKRLIPVTRDPRAPMAQIQQMFAGELTPEEVLKAVDGAGDAARFYADLYVGLYYEAVERPQESLRYITRAAESPAGNKNYMGDVARVHRTLRAPAAGVGAKLAE